jgi:SM-20-related protein
MPTSLPPVVLDATLSERIASALRHESCIVVDRAVPEVVADALAASLRRRADDLSRAGVGRDDRYRRRPTVRGDEIAWIVGDDAATRWLLDWAELLRRELNRQLFLGLFEYECHFASYPVGAFYATHLDAFRGETNRVVSTVLYLNPAWGASDGGELVIYHSTEESPTPLDPLTVAHIVSPRHATLVVFLSEEFPHEVLPSSKERHSIAGWYRVNASTGSRVDPPPPPPPPTPTAIR